MPFSAAEIENAANATLEWRMDRGKTHKQSIQAKPLYDFMVSKQKTFPGGKDYLTGTAKGDYTTTVMGFQHDDSVTYQNPTNLKQFSYPWKLLHAGISFTKHELIKSGISVTDNDGKSTSQHSKSEEIVLANLLEDKIDDMMEGWERGMNTMFWRDGTQDSNEIPGIRSFILNDPTSATVVGSIDQSANTWWRNRANVGFSQGSTASDLTVVNLLQKEFRQLRRYGGNPTKGFAGSDFLEWMEKELRSKGNFTLNGWDKGKMDMSTADIEFKGVTFEYDPSLDDLGLAKYLYLIDPKTVHPMVVEGEDMQKHNPARPENKYVFYRAITYVGGLVCKQRNANGVYSIT